jgi:threonine dehydratase
VVVKLETLNPIRSFKGRGTDWFVTSTLPDRTPMVCASAGNFGQGLAYAARRHSLPITVVAATNANPVKVARMRALGATVELAGEDFDQAKEHARLVATDRGCRFVEDGAEPAIAEGAGTIALELDEWPGRLDAVLVPLGNGALINGIGSWLKARGSTTRVIGVCAAGARCMADSWRAGMPVPGGPVATIADGIAVRQPVPAAVGCMVQVVDDVVLVEDEHIVRAMRVLWQTLRVAVEPAGAAGIGALLAYPATWRGLLVATPLCGANLTPEQARRWFTD